MREQNPSVRQWHAPNGMQLTRLDETSKMKCNKEFLISDGGKTIPTLKLAPMGMVAPWRCQERQILGRADQCLRPLGYGVHYFDKTTQDF